MIGERGREIPEFIHYNLNDNLENTIIVAATSDESALMRKYGAFTAMAIAEFFRDKGHDVLLMMDFCYKICYGTKRDWFKYRRTSC